MANEVFTEEEKKQIREMEIFLEKAFCIEGKCDYIEDVRIISTLETSTSMLFALCDTKRGRFYVTISK